MELKNISFPNEDLNFIENPYPAMKDFREKTPIFYDEKSDIFYKQSPTKSKVRPYKE